MAKKLNSRKLTSGFAKRLKAARSAGGYTQVEFSRLLGIKRDRYAKYELGQAEPPFYVLTRLSELTHQSLDSLIGGRAVIGHEILQIVGTQLGDIQAVSGTERSWWWKSDEQHRLVEHWHLNGRTRQSGIVPRAIGKTRWERVGVDPTKNEYWARHLADLEAQIPFTNFCYEKTMQSGRRHRVCVSGKPIFGDDGSFRGYCGYGFEVRDGEHVSDAQG